MRMVIYLACLALFSAGASAAGYTEKKSGDLSDDGLAPTAVKLKLGDNCIAGDYGAANGTDILPAVGQGDGAKGFVPPLGSGTYSFWVQETGNCQCTYKFRFVVTTPASEGATQETADEPPGTDSRPIKTPPPHQPESL